MPNSATSTALPPSPRRPNSGAAASRRASPTPSSASPSPSPSTKPSTSMTSWAARSTPQCSPNRNLEIELRGMVTVNYCKQFWKAGEFEVVLCGDADSSAVGMDHVRIHPKFLHSNATSHKWALGAFAELLDNAIDEVCTGATYVKVDMLENQKDGSRMLLIEDNGGGMNPDKIRDCMSLGFSTKSKIANTIGQYGNGFKTSTMRLGADVIVFTRCCGKDGKSATQSIGLLSYTFLRSTGKEDTVVPMVHCKQASGMVLSLYSKKKLCYSASIHLLRNHILSLPKHRDSSSKKPKKKLEFPRHKLAYNYFGAAILYPPELVHR